MAEIRKFGAWATTECPRPDTVKSAKPAPRKDWEAVREFMRGL